MADAQNKSENLLSHIQAASVIGLGKLGSPLAACLIHKGFRVHGVDNNPRILDAIAKGEAPVFEPGLEEMIGKNKARLSASTDIEEAVMNSQITFIVVATPSDETGGFSLKYVIPVCEKIGDALKKKKEKHLVVLTSTVMPGSTDRQVVPVLEAHSGKVCGKDFGLCYNPEFIALGSVIRDFLNPDFVLVGESDPQSGEVLNALYQKVCDNQPNVVRMNFVNAELAKLSLNTFVTTKITFSNTLARMCEQLPGANVDVVCAAIGQDSRIGKKYLKGAIGYGGPCFPRDTVAFAALAKTLNVSSFLADATDKTNRAQVSILAELIKSKLGKGGMVGILGLSYKPNTDVVEQSQGVLLAETLVRDGLKVCAFDPQAMENARKVLGETVCFAVTCEECVRKSDLIVMMTPWDVFTSLKPELFQRDASPRVLIDCWRILSANSYRKVTQYIALGLNSSGK
jgi:UDPglucose 6-dehydrogenase